MCAGIIHASYNAVFRYKHQQYLSILKQLGFGQRLMESKINVEVDELVKQARLRNGQPLDPVEMITLCIMNVITSILLGERLTYGHPSLVEIKDRVNDWFTGLVYEIDFFPMFRFVPPFRGRKNHLVKRHGMLLDAVRKEVRFSI